MFLAVAFARCLVVVVFGSSHPPPLAVQEVEDVVFWSKIFLAVGTGALLGLAGIEGWCVRCSPSIALLGPIFLQERVCFICWRNGFGDIDWTESHGMGKRGHARCVSPANLWRA